MSLRLNDRLSHPNEIVLSIHNAPAFFFVSLRYSKSL
jgi:hypothetical protein